MKLISYAYSSLFFISMIQGMIPNKVYGVVPGGIVAGYHTGTGAENSLSVTITVEKAPSDDTEYFWAQQFWLDASIDHGGYFGMQTGGIINGQRVGKMLIVSIWNASNATAEGAAFAQTFGGEGVGYSVRLAHEWEEGEAYTFSLRKDGGLWWQLSVSSSSLGETILGRLEITEDVHIRNSFVNFVEYFGSVNSCNEMEYARVKFDNFFYGSNQLVEPHGFNLYGKCESEGRASISGTRLVMESGISNFTYTPTEEWPSPYNGATPDSSFGLAFNNIGIFNSSDAAIYACLRLFTDGLPSSHNGISQFDIGLKVVSLSDATVQITKSREFNTIGVLNEKAQPPDCSGIFETTTSLYTDIIQVNTSVLETVWSLIDSTNLILKLVSSKELTAN